jgi:hypothetical protein
VLHDRASLFVDHVRIHARSNVGSGTDGAFWDFRRFANRRSEWSDWDIQLSYQGVDRWPFKEPEAHARAVLRGWVTGLLEVVSQTGEKLPFETTLRLTLADEETE